MPKMTMQLTHEQIVQAIRGYVGIPNARVSATCIDWVMGARVEYRMDVEPGGIREGSKAPPKQQRAELRRLLLEVIDILCPEEDGKEA